MDADISRDKPAITALEICALIFVIAVIYGLQLPPGGARNASKKASSKNDEVQFAGAIKQFYTDYGYYPCTANSDSDSQDFFANGGAKMTEVIDILRANNQKPIWTAADDDPRFGRPHNPDIAAVNKLNPRQIIYLDEPYVKDANNPKSGLGSDGAWYDPWGHPYLVKIDSDYNGTILNPYDANAGPKEIKAGVIVWSLGPDGKGATLPTGNGDKNTGANSDDVTSWQ